MDSGQVQREVSTEDFAREIDRAADVAVETISHEVPVVDERITAEQAQNLGKGAIFGGGEVLTRGGKKEVVAELEISRDENRERNPEDFVGEESPLQVAEREQRADEILQNEMGTGLPLEVEITRKGLDGVTQEVAEGVDRLTKQSQYELSNLEELYNTGNRAALDVLGRRVGDRN